MTNTHLILKKQKPLLNRGFLPYYTLQINLYVIYYQMEQGAVLNQKKEAE
jgi:hypothetical protein